MKKITLLIALFIVLGSSINAQTKQDKKAAKAEAAQKDYQNMKALLNAEAFVFEGEWGTSQSGKRINLISNPTFLKMEAKVADGYLPFFGISRNGGYGGDGAIQFKGEVENYTITFDDKKQKAIIKFRAKGNNSEIYDVIINVFGSLSTSININSTNRSTMNYSGKIKKLEKKD